ncbi:MAG: GerAB/ArcD/ProY family transporter [Oscillospiraceae bacterium]|jgi:hypothetical protein|nr:GerAB/ArcD/ProY family transporter [Oscillospiraceae bacterium]
MSENRPVASRIRVRPGRGAQPTVDQHPGWVDQSVRQYARLCAVMLGMQAMVTGEGMVLQEAHSAAWWCMLLAMLGGLLIWIPTWGIMKLGDKPMSLDEAFAAAYGRVAGGALTLVYSVMFAFNAAIGLRVLSSLVGHYMLMDSDQTVVSLIALGALALILVRRGLIGMARLAWAVHTFFGITMVIASIVLLQNANVDNLFPLMGNEVHETLGSIPIGASAFAGVLSMAMMPKMTGSARPVRFHAGLRALLFAGIGAALLVLVTNLCMPPRAVQGTLVWGREMMLAAAFVQNEAFRLFFLMLLVIGLIFALGNSIGTSAMLAQEALGVKARAWPDLVVCLVLAVVLLLFPAQSFMDNAMPLLVYRLPLALIPIWVTWAVLAIRMKRKGAAA